MNINWENSRELKMHTRMREICLSIMKESAESLRSIDERFPTFERPDLQKLMEDSKELEIKYLTRQIKVWGQFSLEHKQKIDRIKGINNG